ncbi:AbrB family transcriptional regulator [uncultured Roseobacter sp.]|uniref:AbrB family transcriptional regulator n=1 Tax=uncultured Roseobacter sp. TaxID=114847 RepID=UPI002625AA60|nr:AbrB family transcriptional regulator [uncultured Roseobacter sp.]
MIGVLTAISVALSGVLFFHVLNLPLPWLLGPIGACLLAALGGLRMAAIAPVNEAMRTVLGVAVGASLTPAVLVSLPAMWPTLLMVPLMVMAVGLIGVPYFRRLCGYDLPTAYYAAMPGGLQDMVLFGQEAGANVRTLSLIHATRLLVIVATLPFLIQGIWEADLTNPPGRPIGEIPVDALVIMVLCAVFGWWGARRIGLFGAAILGPLIVTAAITVSGGLHHRPPAEVIWAAQFVIGMSIGCKYTGVTLAEIRRDLTASLGFCILLIILTLIVVETVYGLGLAPGLETLLAFAPGGQAELTVLALIVGADMAFVVAHHVLRIFIVIIGAPLAARLLTDMPHRRNGPG